MTKARYGDRVKRYKATLQPDGRGLWYVLDLNGIQVRAYKNRTDAQQAAARMNHDPSTQARR